MAEPVVRTSTRLWSQEVAIAEAQSGEVRPKNKEPGYEWGKRKFDTGPGVYEQPVVPD